MENWVCIYTTNETYLAEIAKEILFDEGIQSVSVNKKDSNYLFGAIELYVEREHAVRSKYLLRDIEKQNPPDKPDQDRE